MNQSLKSDLRGVEVVGNSRCLNLLGNNVMSQSQIVSFLADDIMHKPEQCYLRWAYPMRLPELPEISGNNQMSQSRGRWVVLAFLLAHPRTAYSRETLMREVWGWDFGDSSTVTVHVRRLREKVEADPAHPTRLVTVWGVGYRWDPADGT